MDKMIKTNKMNDMEKKQYQTPILRVVDVDDSQLLLMASPGTGGQDIPGGNAARGNSRGWDEEDF